MDKAKMMEVNDSEATFASIAELQSASTAAASRILRLDPSGTSLGVEPRMAASACEVEILNEAKAVLAGVHLTAQ